MPREAYTPIVLPCGRRVLGWKAASDAMGSSRQALLGRAKWDRSLAAWLIPQRKPVGRPRKDAR
jgi:hypothetical protein